MPSLNAFPAGLRGGPMQIKAAPAPPGQRPEARLSILSRAGGAQGGSRVSLGRMQARWALVPSQAADRAQRAKEVKVARERVSPVGRKSSLGD